MRPARTPGRRGRGQCKVRWQSVSSGSRFVSLCGRGVSAALKVDYEPGCRMHPAMGDAVRIRSLHQAVAVGGVAAAGAEVDRSEEHTSELTSLMRISYAVFCLQKQT